MTWLLAFLWTLALELPVYTVVLDLRRWWAPVALTLAVNAISHPLLWFAFPHFAPFALYVLAGEAAVIALEAALLALVVPPRRALVASIAANVTSAVIGSLVVHVL